MPKIPSPVKLHAVPRLMNPNEKKVTFEQQVSIFKQFHRSPNRNFTFREIQFWRISTRSRTIKTVKSVKGELSRMLIAFCVECNFLMRIFKFIWKGQNRKFAKGACIYMTSIGQRKHEDHRNQHTANRVSSGNVGSDGGDVNDKKKLNANLFEFITRQLSSTIFALNWRVNFMPLYRQSSHLWFRGRWENRFELAQSDVVNAIVSCAAVNWRKRIALCSYFPSEKNEKKTEKANETWRRQNLSFNPFADASTQEPTTLSNESQLSGRWDIESSDARSSLFFFLLFLI